MAEGSRIIDTIMSDETLVDPAESSPASSDTGALAAENEAVAIGGPLGKGAIALSAFWEIAQTLLLALLIFTGVRAVVQNFKVEGSSMEPNLHSGQYLLVNKVTYWGLNTRLFAPRPSNEAQGGNARFHPFGPPQRGDVVVFRFPKDPRRDFIKRVIALPGEEVAIRGGQVYINGKVLREPYQIENPGYSQDPLVVPPGHYYVLGDNRNSSSDSHVWGTVPLEHIVGKAWLSYWPLDAWGMAPNYSEAAFQP